MFVFKFTNCALYADAVETDTHPIHYKLMSRILFFYHFRKP